MIRYAIMITTALTLFANTADYSKYSTDTLLDIRTGTTTAKERNALHTELQKRLQSMTPRQMER
ncbi:MAG: hypothetical protein R3302_05265, partial [Sulfurimonadaceae bacterium]|nr:hypothetical protein [Sulfurimonadaceae bacterium]